MSKWQTNSLRLTVFPSPTADIDNKNWWEAAVGSAPETITSKRQLGETSFEGNLGNGRLKLTVTPLRIDWFYSPYLDNSPDEGVRLLTLGLFEQQLSIFQDLIVRWLSEVKGLNSVRLAFGTLLFQPVTNRNEGYKLLIPYLRHVEIDPENSSDLFYQINRQRNSISPIQNLSINRLSKWSVIRLQPVIGLSNSPGVLHQLEDVYASSLELDVNTTPDYEGEFNSDQLRTICNELIDLGK